MSRLLGSEWKHDTLGGCCIPREMGNIFKCWGETEHDTDVLYSVSHVSCSNSDGIYVSSELSAGSIEFSYRWYKTDRLGQERFYRVLQSNFADVTVPNGNAHNDLDDPASHTRLVSLSGAIWKTTLCSWRYKKYPRLHDMVLKMARVDHPSQSLLVECKLLGISRNNALSFCGKFMEALQCRR